MRYHKLLWSLTLVWLASAEFTFAQPATLTLDEAMKIALQNNRQLQIARLEMEKSDYRVSEAYGNAMPNISASGSYTRALKKPVFFLPGSFMNLPEDQVIPIEIGSDNSIQFGFQATQILFNSIVFTGVGTAKIFQKASREIYRGAYNQTVANVKRAFAGVLFVKNVYEMTKASLKNAEDNLKTVETLNKQGLVSDYDFIRAQVQVGNVGPSVVEAERNVLLASNSLKMMLGMSPDKEINPIGELTFEPLDPGILTTAEERMLTNNATLKALDYQKQVNEEIISIYRAESYPTIAAFGNYQWQAQKNSLKFAGDDFVRSSQVGVSLNVSLFNGFQSSARKNQAEVDFLKSEEQLKATADGLLTQVKNIRLRLEEAQKRIASQGKTVEQAEKGYKIATTRYTAGTGTQLEINDADLALMRARVNRIQAIFDYNNAKTDLEELISLTEPRDSK